MKPTIQRCHVTPQQALTVVDQVVVALERGDTSTARCYAESLRARLQVQTVAENVVLDEVVRIEEPQAARVTPPQGEGAEP
jgi:glucose-6-phosphate dehydrogenase assembly protein OpcA